MAELAEGGEAAEAGEAGMEAESAASNVLDDVTEEAEMGAEVSETTETSAKLNKLVQKRMASVDASLDKIKGEIGLEGSVEDTINDIQSGKVTPDTVKMQDWAEKQNQQVKASVGKIQDENGESGKTLNESPKTKAHLIEKWGQRAQIALSILGLILTNTLFKPKGIQQCFQMPTCGSGGDVTAINCPQEYCNCTNISKCGGYPACNLPSSNCMYYYFQSMDTKTVVSAVPYITYSAYQAANPPTSDTLKKILILLGILIIGGAVVFMLYKVSNK